MFQKFEMSIRLSESKDVARSNIRAAPWHHTTSSANLATLRLTAMTQMLPASPHGFPLLVQKSFGSSSRYLGASSAGTRQPWISSSLNSCERLPTKCTSCLCTHQDELRERPLNVEPAQAQCNCCATARRWCRTSSRHCRAEALGRPFRRTLPL